MRSWHLVQKGYLPEEEGYREALFTLGNGYFATRGAAPECIADGIHYPGTYLAGGYNRLQTEMAGRIIENEDLVNLPNWLPLRVRVAGEPWFHVDRAELRDYRQALADDAGYLSILGRAAYGVRELFRYEVRKALGADRIVGAWAGDSRHRAMSLAEAGADYL